MTTPSKDIITKTIWEGKIPTHFSVDPAEAEALRGPKDLEPCFVRLRQTLPELQECPVLHRLSRGALSNRLKCLDARTLLL